MGRSPYMLAVAASRDSAAVCSPEEEARKAKRVWVHGLGERTGLPAASVDLYVLSFVVHELPQQVRTAGALQGLLFWGAGR